MATEIFPITGVDVTLTYPDGIHASVIAKFLAYSVAELHKTGKTIEMAVARTNAEAKVVIEYYQQGARYGCEVMELVAIYDAIGRGKGMLERMGLDPEDRDDALEDMERLKDRLRRRYE